MRVMKRSLIMILPLLFLLSACPDSDQQSLVHLDPDSGIEEQKAHDFNQMASSGDLTGAINRMTDAPCPGCANTQPGVRAQRSPAQRQVHMIAEVGNTSCFPRLATSRSVRALNIDLRNSNMGERGFMNRFAAGLIDIAGQDQARRLVGDLRVVYHDVLRLRNDGNCLPGHQLTPGEVNMGRRCPDGSRVPMSEGILVHEIGHYVANRGGWYPRYERAVTRRCQVSRYCTHTQAGRAINHRREEFAEVFAAFLLSTDRLKAECPESYQFMKTQMFNNSNHHCDSR